jgi:hypothetical protein
MTGARSDLRVSSVYVPATAAVSTGVRCAVSAAPKEREIRSSPHAERLRRRTADGAEGRRDPKSGRRRGDGEKMVRNGSAGCALCARACVCAGEWRVRACVQVHV